MMNKEDVSGTEQLSSVEKKPKMHKNMVEDKSEFEEQGVSEEIKVEKVEEPQELIVEEEPLKEDTLAQEDTVNQKEEPEKSEASDKKPTIEEKKEKSASANAKNSKAEIAKTKGEEEKGHHAHEDELAHEDFSKYTKIQLVDLIKMLAKHDSPMYAERYLKQIEPLFDAIRKSDILEAKEVYKKENENEEGFSFKADELTDRFDANTRLINDKKYHFIKEREAVRKANLVKAEAALEHLRKFVDSEESSASFNKFKELQSEWKAIGDVPGQYSKTLWANYNALINRFYDQRSIYFELKELDRKKNYEAKVKICERAEALEQFENLKDAINTLNDLHDEYKHFGPIPQNLQEDLWIRFKAASDKVYQKRKEFVSDLKVVLLENLTKKEALIESIKLFVEFDSDRIKEWNTKTKELLELQKTWETIGGLPREKSKDINKSFWASFKQFFHNKSNFFKKLDAERKGNYDAKLELIGKADALKESTDWFKTANDFKALQQKWKDIGPVPEKVRNQVYEKFKTACDFFFDAKRSNSKSEESNYKENLKFKKNIISLIEGWATKADEHIEEFKVKTKEFAAVGFVPRKEINSIKEKFSACVDGFINALNSDEDVKDTLRVGVELGDILGSKNSEQILYNKEQNIRRQVQHLEDDVALWKNNLEFFAHSKNADDLRKEVNLKIEKAEEKVKSLKGQLRILRKV